MPRSKVYKEGMNYLSPSQYETAELCTRKWWFGYGPTKLPRPPGKGTDFGSVVHAICERFLLADETGRVPAPPAGSDHALLGGVAVPVWKDGPFKGQAQGNPADIFPPDWNKVDGRTLNGSESAMAKTLYEAAVEGGVLERRPGREIEKPVEGPIIPGWELVGYIDVAYPDEIEDHKSMGQIRYALSPKKLAQATQMLTYAYSLIQADPNLDLVRLRHNVWSKSPLKVRKIEVPVTRAQIMANWALFQEKARYLTEWKTFDGVWQDVPGPHANGACSKYGGCPYRGICSGGQDLAEYRIQVEAQQKELEKSAKRPDQGRSWADLWDRDPETLTEGTEMDIFAKRNELVGTTPPETVTTATPVNGGALAPVAAPPPLAGDVAPPWAF